ncbi:hypothetical protein [Niveispirillum sp. BGYR6]|uniref:hypothetical protein n=1 Tax=Niveispirillum sp. BGYR6 TaxID=2971249 RepID=UPI0022B9BE89|nr:hypothetical protein [Niveispirillum sp. BGYR6]MDG5496494.1 hypothetical protein [Niveispirillum sp. BGYR6]
MVTPVAATSLDLRYDVRQDRLVLTARTAATGMDMHMTRRLTRALLSGLLDLLMQSSELVARSGPDHRGDVLLFEHLEAVNRVAVANPAPSSAPAALVAEIAEEPPRLVERIDVTSHGEVLRLSFHDADQEQAWMNLPRELVHQFINMLLIKSREAGWNLDELAWIDHGGQIQIPAGALPC